MFVAPGSFLGPFPLSEKKTLHFASKYNIYGYGETDSLYTGMQSGKP